MPPYRVRFLELFAGAGGLSLGLELAGHVCVAHAEIEPHARAVLRHRWPDTPLYGDVTDLDGAALVAAHGPIDLLSGGSPCQDLSVAGKREGLGGARSGLFYHQVRIWKELQDAQPHHPVYLLWENVPGAFSSQGGRDFASVLSAIVDPGSDLVVPKDGWGRGGVAAGRAAVAAWRVLDAQFFGVPQRRARVFVVGVGTGGHDPAEILALSESLCGDTDASGPAGEGAAGGVEGGPVWCIKGAAIGRKPEAGPQFGEVLGDASYTLQTDEIHAVLETQPAPGVVPTLGGRGGMAVAFPGDGHVAGTLCGGSGPPGGGGAGYTVVVGVDLNQPAAGFLGRELDADLLTEIGITDGLDAAGECGEYHTFVYDGPSFAYPLLIQPGKPVDFNGHRFLDLTLAPLH